MKLSIVVPTFCEAENLELHYNECIKALAKATPVVSPAGSYEYIVIDNCSPDATVEVALRLRERDPNVKVLVNDRNYGPVLSPFHGLMTATGDVALLIAADLQEPPNLLPALMQALSEGYEAAIGYKQSASENLIMWKLRGFYYRLLSIFVNSGVPQRFSGFGLYSRSLLERFRTDTLSEPSLRILLPLHASRVKLIPYIHQQRYRGDSSYSLYGYSREAIRTLVRNGTKFPRLAGKLASLFAALVVLIIPVAISLKIIYWQSFGPGVASLIVIILGSNSLLFGFLAIVLDRLDQILSRLSPTNRDVKQTARFF